MKFIAVTVAAGLLAATTLTPTAAAAQGYHRHGGFVAR